MSGPLLSHLPHRHHATWSTPTRPNQLPPHPPHPLSSPLPPSLKGLKAPQPFRKLPWPLPPSCLYCLLVFNTHHISPCASSAQRFSLSNSYTPCRPPPRHPATAPTILHTTAPLSDPPTYPLVVATPAAPPASGFPTPPSIAHTLAVQQVYRVLDIRSFVVSIASPHNPKLTPPVPLCISPNPSANRSKTLSISTTTSLAPLVHSAGSAAEIPSSVSSSTAPSKLTNLLPHRCP